MSEAWGPPRLGIEPSRDKRSNLAHIESRPVTVFPAHSSDRWKRRQALHSSAQASSSPLRAGRPWPAGPPREVPCAGQAPTQDTTQQESLRGAEALSGTVRRIGPRVRAKTKGVGAND